MAKKFNPENMALLDEPERRTWQDPELLLRVAGVAPGHVVLDMGAGTGYLAFPAARVVAPRGRVFAVDVEPRMVEELRRRAAAGGVRNLFPVLASEERTPLADAFVDIAFMVNTLHELEGGGTLREVHRILRPLGRFVVVDWKREPMDRGPPVEHRIDARQARVLVEGTSFLFERAFTPGPYHWGLLFSRP